jgi:amino acid transporter/mannitol/fructose-specific phosphotransferase system IIA component (Ntr-type)
MNKHLKRELSLMEVICVSSGVMISSGLFILPAIAYGKAGPAMILAYFIASLMVIPTVLSKSELVTAMPVTGGIYVFADRSMGPIMGTVGGLTAWISLAFKSAFSLLAMGIFVILLKPDVTEVQIKTLGVLWCLVFTFINIKGVKFSGHFQTITVILLVLFLLIYVFVGAFHVEPGRYVPFMPQGLDSVFLTAGLVFIAFSGTTKVTAIAGEVKNPGRNLPIGIFYSWGLVSILYIVVVAITVGILEPGQLIGTFTPISTGGGVILGRFGIIIMTLAALLAFISTGNAGLLAASRNPMAMGRDELLPGFFTKLSAKGTPSNAILTTSGIMIAVILFLDLETFVKTASALKLVLFIIANLAHIFMREANIHHYRPKYIAPFYPWAQIIGIVSYVFLLIEMGRTPVILVIVFIATGIAWYFLFAHGKIKREYALLHLIERITGIRSTDQVLEEELREILIERNGISQKWFEKLILEEPVTILDDLTPSHKLAHHASSIIHEKMSVDTKKLVRQINLRLQEQDIIMADGVACLSAKVTGRKKFGLQIYHARKGIQLPGDRMVYALFIVVFSEDEWNYQVHTLSRLLKILQFNHFTERWKKAGSNEAVQQLLLTDHVD